jgi:NADPH-dependent curcumin reductase CurA
MFDYMHLAEEATAVLTQAAEEGKLNVQETETLLQKPFEDLPTVWSSLFEGTNSGKIIVQIAPL